MSKLRTQTTMCPMNCHPTLCGMKVQTSDNQLVRIEGDPDNPDSRGILCMRGKAAHEIVGNSARILKPRLRENPRSDDWQEADWEQALDFIAGKMREVGRESVGFWQAHGNWSNDYAFGLKRAQMDRFCNLYGCQYWNPAMICWGLGAFGLGITGAIETSTKEDMSAHSDLIVLWGANSVSQANTLKHVEAAKRRGAQLIVIDVRLTEAAAMADEVLLLKPGTDSDLALAMMHVLISESLTDDTFIEENTVGFDALKSHVSAFTPAWAADRTGLSESRIIEFSRNYAKTKASMLVLGGSSIHKGANTWQAARSIACLPALTGKFGHPGGGIGPRHGGRSHGVGFVDLSASDRRVPGSYIPNQMEAIVEALESGRVKVLFTLGSNFLSSFPDSNRVKQALRKAELVVAYDLFENQTIRETAHVVLPGTIWLEELGGKSTNTHIYLCDQILKAAGSAKPVYELYKGLAQRLDVKDVYPWRDQEEAINKALAHPATGHATVKSMRKNGGRARLNISAIAYPTLEFHTPSGKLEFDSERAEKMGLPGLPMPSDSNVESAGKLLLAHGRTFAHFHSFYDHGRALPSLAAREPVPLLWISPEDAKSRNVEEGTTIRMSNHRGSFIATAKVTPRIPDGVVWIRDGWPGLNTLTDGAAVLPRTALSTFPFSVGQSNYGAQVSVTRIDEQAV
ncbi:MAG: molybdopterin-dependent oxidoreductase [Granulosicoccus sp.]|nr:molybdopterin-dependent oxidoreductase [Granulosicoccus sp.]